MTLRKRASGVLLHPTSLPGPCGTGDLGLAAYKFADFLAACGQSWWQMLPVNPPGKGNSPYMSMSVFAGTPLLISLEKLAEDDLLAPDDIKPTEHLVQESVNYEAVNHFKDQFFREAFTAFEERKSSEDHARFKAFCEANNTWLADYALFCALKKLHRGLPWTDWEPEIRLREPSALERMQKRLGREVRYQCFLQYQFRRQWSELKQYCSKLGIGLIGDIPIFPAHDSAEVWANQELFYLDAYGRPTVVAGVPPDYFSETGQLWGNPLYRWHVLRERGYDWWIARLRSTYMLFDAVRLDHFIGFCRYWEVPAGAQTAEKGHWVEVPGEDFFEKVLGALGPLELIAEDLGAVTQEVYALRDRLDFPGMRVLQFAFCSDMANYHLPHNYSRRCVVYTGTHDNNTTVGWFTGKEPRATTHSREEFQKEREYTLSYIRSDGQEIHWDMISLALSSVADIAIIPAQDLIGLGAEARMNQPGTNKGNWEWRLLDNALTENIGSRLSLLTETYGRTPRSRKINPYNKS